MLHQLLKLLLAAAPAFAASNANSPMGTNVWFFRDWVSEYSMADAFKMSRAWVPHCLTCQPSVFDTGEGRQLDLDEHGWVRSLPRTGVRYTSVGTLMFDGFDGHYPAGQYTVLYEGEGTLAYSRDAVRNSELSTPGRDVIDVKPSAGGIWLIITATDPQSTGNYLRNIRVLMPGIADDSAEIFHPDFLARLEQFRLIRVMQWMETNSSTQSRWSARTHVDDARWNTPGGAGVPVEILIALANRLSADLWVSMPHQADDAYMTAFATLARDTLAPGLKIWVEYSNEVWNGSGGYNQSYWVQAQGVAKWPDPAIPPYDKQINWHGMRSAQMCDLWKSTFGDDRERVICVMGSQSANPWTASTALNCPMWKEGAPCSAHGIDVVAGAPYFGGYLGTPNFEAQVLAWTKEADGGLDRFFAELTTGALQNGPPGGALARAYQEMEGYIKVAKDNGLAAVAYEGGSHFASNTSNATVLRLFEAASRDPRMGDVYDAYLSGWRARGGQMFVHYFNVGQNSSLGVFGALEYLDSPPSPKSLAIERYIQNNPCWWSGCGQGPQ